MLEVAEASLRNLERCGKIFCRPKIAFFRGNLVRRVAPRYSQFSATSSECRCRAPTSEGCPPWCLERPDAWPDNREFLALEMEVVGRRAHSSTVSHFPVSNRCACPFRCWRGEEELCAFDALARINSSSEKRVRLEKSILVLEREAPLHSKTRSRTILSYYPGEYSLPI